MALAVTTSVKELRGWGLVMASLSKWTSDLEGAVFLVVAIAAVVFGVGAVLGQSWSVTPLFVLSSLGAAYSFGGGLLMLAWPARSGLILRIVIASVVAGWGIPFLYMALAIRSLAREERLNGDCRAGGTSARRLGRDA